MTTENTQEKKSNNTKATTRSANGKANSRTCVSSQSNTKKLQSELQQKIQDAMDKYESFMVLTDKLNISATADLGSNLYVTQSQRHHNFENMFVEQKAQ